MRIRLIVLGVAVLTATAVPAALGAGSPGYVRLSQGDIASFIGTGLSCIVETVQGNPAQVAGVECGRGSGGNVIGGSYWVSLQLRDDLIVGTSQGGRPLARPVYSRPKRPTYQTAIGVPGLRVLPVLPPRLLDVHESGIWCSAQVSRTVASGQQIVACFLTAANGQPKNGSYGFVVSTKLTAVVRIKGKSSVVVWSHKQ
jgi:hypothetical protein